MSRRLPAALLSATALLTTLPAGASALGQPGDVDPTFHGGAPVVADLAQTFPHVTGFSDLVRDGAGRIVTVGSTIDANGFTATVAARYGADGAADASFGGGSQVLQLGSARPGGPFSFARTVFTVPGRYVGFSVYRTDANSRGDVTAQLLRSDGTRDLDIGSAGLLTRDPVSAPADVNTESATAGPDGSVYVTGTYDTTPSGRKLALSKFNPDGTAAAGWGTNNGTTVISFSKAPGDPGTYGSRLLVQPNNRILVGGVALLPTGRFGMLLARFNTQTGAPDPTFGPDGTGALVVDGSDRAQAYPDSSIESLAQGPDGAIYAAGYGEDAQGDTAAAVIRVTPAGRLDPSFGTGGIKRVQLAETDGRSYVNDIAVQDDGRIVVAAGTQPEGGGNGEGRLLRLNQDGSLDETFGTHGVVSPALGDAPITISSILVDRGRLLGTGAVRTGSNQSSGVVARFLLAPLPDPPAPTAAASAPTTTPGPATSTTTAPVPVASRGVIAFAARRLKVDVKGRVKVPLACSTAGACRGKLALVAATGKVTIAKVRPASTYARAAYNVPAGRKTTATLKLGPTNRRRARGRSGLRVRLVIAPAGSRSRTYAVTLGR